MRVGKGEEEVGGKGMVWEEGAVHDGAPDGDGGGEGIRHAYQMVSIRFI